MSPHNVAYARAISTLNAVCMGTHKNSINVPITIYICSNKAKECTLIDSGATENFINH